MINMDTAIDYMYGLKAKNIRYSMDYSRTGVDGTGDCSGTVYASLRKARCLRRRSGGKYGQHA
ncbi:hypothetical protein V4S28_01720 [Enterococcus cecorum]